MTFSSGIEHPGVTNICHGVYQYTIPLLEARGPKSGHELPDSLGCRLVRIESRLVTRIQIDLETLTSERFEHILSSRNVRMTDRFLHVIPWVV